MKKVATCALILLVSFAYSYETIEYFSKAIKNAFHYEEKDLESKESNEKGEDSNFLDDLYFTNRHHNNKLLSGYMELSRLISTRDHNFSSSDYSCEVYSPPETLL